MCVWFFKMLFFINRTLELQAVFFGLPNVLKIGGDGKQLIELGVAIVLQ